ncbi:hypothetical protein [Fodinicurvata sp. EGI_FJ10296]|uniref:hypothetical protein n=1 Tax=Fodinicurvata sp. EGI_FJ10296 TaxID=3231908 RepID=UPI00345445B6
MALVRSGLSRAETSSQFDVTQTTIDRWCNGAVIVPGKAQEDAQENHGPGRLTADGTTEKSAELSSRQGALAAALLKIGQNSEEVAGNVGVPTDAV